MIRLGVRKGTYWAGLGKIALSPECSICGAGAGYPEINTQMNFSGESTGYVFQQT
jgi:hypothetical protein